MTTDSSLLAPGNSLPICKLMGAHLATVAARNKSTKFVKIIGDQCIPNYPDRNLPTLLIYGDGDVKGQLVGAAQLGGLNMKPEGTFFQFILCRFRDSTIFGAF
jgi:hypothetical protein